ncbi:alpha/beta fold hydrolase [Ramlibacter sp. AW1]|uniref:Alpha/beta fold hydrolase n=1 Tax=Ramlibacter aurantiacus TaxID=2801330 RepID=A0A936ZKB3_9BURK|nr:alpha/beta hydrolase [Ramlibacter aurantiacus]MBL0422919.1 alpha/beta fold hydrolase [Ramlibacter aurantiacus]
MLHGIRGYAETFAGIAAALQPGYRVIAYDQRGRGRSDWDPRRRYDTPAYVGDLEAVVAQLGLDRFDLLGHSMGGINAIVYAARHPARVGRLVIEEAGPGAFEHSAGARRIQAELRSTPASFDSWEQATAFMRMLRPTVTEAAREQRLRSMLKPAPDGGFTWRYDHAGIAATRLAPDPAKVIDLQPLVAGLDCPALLVFGDRSDYMQPAIVERMGALNPRLRLARIAGAGHYVHDDNPADFCAAVRSFLQETEDPHAR